MIKKRNLDPSLVQWIMQQTGLGPGVGELHWVAPASSSTSQFRTQLQRWGVEQNYKIHTDPVEAEKAMVANRNDVMLIMPGNYTVTDTAAAPMTWSKDYTHMIGLGPPQKHEYAGRGVVIRTINTTGVFAMINTGDLCQFHNIAFQQWGQATAALTAFREEGHMNSFNGCHFFGQIRSNTIALTTSSSFEVNAAVTRAGNADIFTDCVIGGSGGAKRTGANGTLLFATGGTIGAGCDMQFRNTQFMSWAEDTDPCAILVAGNYAADRLLLFEGCTFYNFRENHNTTMPAYVVRDACNTTHDIVFKNSAHHGFTAWTNNQTHCFVTMPAVDESGGEAVAADAA